MVLSNERGEREAVRQYAAQALAGLYYGPPEASPHRGGRAAAERLLEAFDLAAYAEKHAHLPCGATSFLSPYIRHGLISLREVRDAVMSKRGAASLHSFLLALLRRAYWRILYREQGKLLADPSRDGSEAESDLLELLPRQHFGLYCIDEALRQLYADGYLPYEARLMLASFLLHWKKWDWRQGFRLFQEHLLDADPAVNALSWQWVRGALNDRPYLFNQERVQQLSGGKYCAQCAAYRCPFAGSMKAVAERVREVGERDQ